MALHRVEQRSVVYARAEALDPLRLTERTVEFTGTEESAGVSRITKRWSCTEHSCVPPR